MPQLEDLATVVGLAMKAATAPVVAEVSTLTRDLATLRAELADLKARPPVPGPPGADGAPGRDGTPGEKGDPGLRYRGVYQDATAYALGDVVTWAGGAWHCNAATVEKPGDASQVWTLIVKRGRDAKGAR